MFTLRLNYRFGGPAGGRKILSDHLPDTERPAEGPAFFVGVANSEW